MPAVGTGRVREGNKLIEDTVHERTLRAKENLEIKVKEAQTMKVKHYKNPAPPENPQEAKAMQLLITKGQMRSDELVPLLELMGSDKDDLAVRIFHKLVDAGKATRTADATGVHYALKQVEEMDDSPYKGKRIKWAPKCVHGSTIREGGMEEVTCEWSYTLEDVP